jgi:hypothetical protein
MKAPPSFSGPLCLSWRECIACNTFVNTYIPQLHQVALHRDPHTFVGNFGGYGTGKTLTSRQEIIKHILLTPNANILIGANVNSQYEQTIQRELESDIPASFVVDSSNQKKYLDLANGSRIMYRPFDDPDKLRSYNLSMFVIVEASETSTETYSQLKTRLRNMASATPLLDPTTKIQLEDEKGRLRYDADWRRGIIESNPDSGWIRTDVLLVSDDIQLHGDIKDVYIIPDSQKDLSTSSHVSETGVNKYLPVNFVRDLTRNKPTWWTSRYVYGSFSYSEGLVYPDAMKHFVHDFEIPTDWPRIIAYDYGLVDDSVFLFGAIDSRKGHLYIYKEVRTNGKDVAALARLFKEASADIPVGGMLAPPLIDPKSGLKRDYQRRSLIDHFLEYGISFRPGYINVDARVMRLNTYLASGRMSIFDSCDALRTELRDYKFPARTLDGASSNSDKPIDKNNHGINALEWIVMDLPSDPRNILQGVFDRYGKDITSPEEPGNRFQLPHALRDSEDAFHQESLYTHFM